MKSVIGLCLAALVAGCASITPDTITRAVVGHQSFPSLSQEVAVCVAGRPDVEAQIRPHFNLLVDKWQAAGDLEPNENLLRVLVDAKSQIVEAETAWVSIKTAIVDSGLDCGPWVAQQVQSIEQTFGEIKTAVISSERVVYYGEWALLLGRVVLGQSAKVTRI